MMDFNNEEEIGKLLKSACKPVAPSPELREGLRQRLTLEAGSAVLSTCHSPVGWTRSGLIAAAVVISGAIGYGIWLSLNVVPALVP